MLDKTKLRGSYLLQRAMMDDEDKKNWSAQVCELLGDLASEMKPNIIHTFIPLASEVDISPLIRSWIVGSPTVVVPRTLPNGDMDHWLLDDWDQLVYGRFETQHPEGTDQFFGQADLIVVPGLAYDPKGTRLGYGAGYYDAFLAHCKGMKVAVGFPFQLTESLLPREAHDIPMDVIITDRVHRVGS